MKLISDEIRKICMDFITETSCTIYLKNAIKIGENSNGDILCTDIDCDDYMNRNYYITANIIMDKHVDENYGFNYEFEILTFKHVNNYEPYFFGEKSGNDESLPSDMVIYPNALELILAELKSDLQWLSEQRNMQDKDLFYRQIKTLKNRGECKSENLSWEQRVESMKFAGELEFLCWRRPREFNRELCIYEKMVELGQELFEQVYN